MTTHNTHHEHSDLDASFVEQQSVPENTVAPSTSETVSPETTESQAGIPSSDKPATPVEPLIEASRETNTVSDASTIQVEEQQATPAQENLPQNSSSSEAITGSEAAPIYNASIPLEGATEGSYSDKVLLPEPSETSETKEEEIRPFTSFIEEFRQAEEARLNATRQEIPAESFELLSPEIAPLIIDVHTPVDDVALPIVSQETAPTEPKTINIDIHSAADGSPQDLQQVVKDPAQEQEAPLAPPARAVSPLLRPATRLRVPRHGTRHIREDAITEKVESPVNQPASSVTSEAPVPSVTVPQTEQVVSTPPAEEPEQPRPVRRYRFDRPASTLNGSTGATSAQPPTIAPQPVEESKEKDVQSSTAPAEVAQQGNGQVTEVTTANSAKTENTTPIEDPSVEQPAQKQPQELPLTANTRTPSTSERSGRRRQGQEHQKEQHVTASTTDAVSSTLEHVIEQSGEVAPEDLPPLEYAELQKANTRRRRRHRPGTSSNGSTIAATTEAVQQPVQPTPIVTPAAITPQAPAASAHPIAPRPATTGNGSNGDSNQYTIVSGYTVSQMNQGNELAGPFMGPEPSPARGSVVTRDGRTARAESQRSPIYPPARTHEAGPSSASLNHFASTISQAIQTQTDRMVAELRRTSQAPTNVSVSLPPFPSTERVGVFVDVANLLYSARTLRIPVDFGKLLDFLRGNRRLIRAHAYCPTSPQAGDEQMFLQAVKGLGYRITTKNYKTFSSGAKKADLDLDLCMDVVRIVDGKAVDCIVLVSGDSDFMPMLDYCSDHGVRVEVAAFDEAMSATLRQSCDLFINLSMLEEIRS